MRWFYVQRQDVHLCGDVMPTEGVQVCNAVLGQFIDVKGSIHWCLMEENPMHELIWVCMGLVKYYITCSFQPQVWGSSTIFRFHLVNLKDHVKLYLTIKFLTFAFTKGTCAISTTPALYDIFGWQMLAATFHCR